MRAKLVYALAFGLAVLSFGSYGMGLRSLVALPVEKGGLVWRGVATHNSESDANQLSLNLAYGIDHKKTLFLGLPYQLSHQGNHGPGDISLTYRQIIQQQDTPQGTRRLGLLGGLILPTESEGDAAFQLGAVATWFKGRNEWDVDALYQIGTSDRLDSGRFDLSWQHRLAPSTQPDWGIKPELYSVIELGLRWQEHSSVVHQLTLGLQWVQGRWVLEGGLVQDLNNQQSTGLLFSVRFH